MISSVHLSELQKELNLALYGSNPMTSPYMEPTREEQIDNVFDIFQREGRVSTKQDIENEINRYEQMMSNGYCGAQLCVVLSYMK